MISKSNPLFVHSDIGHAMLAVKRSDYKICPNEIQRSLFDFLSTQIDAGGAGLIFPAFNYQYGSTRKFDVQQDAVEVGLLPEWVRKNLLFERTRVPFFSFISEHHLNLRNDEVINPFGPNSGFHWLFENDATLVLFGAPISTLTFIHYVEEMCGGPAYRYIKKFPGVILEDGVEKKIDFEMHVRPKGVGMDYDWERIESDLLESSVLLVSDFSKHFKYLKARELFNFWQNKIQADPLYLIDSKSRHHFGPITQGGHQRVCLEQYENARKGS